MTDLYDLFFFEPVLNLFIFLHGFISDFGILIIILTIIIRVVLWPFAQAGIKSQKAMLTIQPKLENLKRQYKDKKEELARATMELYKQEHINPFSSCLPLLIQLPFMFALFQVLMLDVSKDAQQYLYTFIDMPPTFAQFSFIFGDLSKPSIVLAILAGLSQFWQGKKLEALRPARQANQKEDMTTALNKQMLYMMPVMTVIFGITLPGGLSLYWLVTTLLLIFQQEYFGNKESKAL